MLSKPVIAAASPRFLELPADASTPLGIRAARGAGEQHYGHRGQRKYCITKSPPTSTAQVLMGFLSRVGGFPVCTAVKRAGGFTAC